MTRNQSLWNLGFRPFFLFGAGHAVFAMLIWTGFLMRWFPLSGHLDPVQWHSHEMLFGFSTAIIAGFLLTASQNWTGIRGVHGRPLKLLVIVWALGRLLPLTDLPPVLSAAVDLSFYPLLAYFLIPYLRGPDVKEERVFFLLFALLFAGNLLVHLEGLRILSEYGREGIYLALDTVLLVIVFMGGRVIPFFTESEKSRSQPKTWPWVEWAALGSVPLFLILDFASSRSTLFAAVAILAGVSHLVRLYGWQVSRVRRVPLLWVLHVAYLWIGLGFVLSGLSVFDVLPRSIATHAFTAGGIGGMIYGMIARVALGHTGRPLHPSAWVVAGFYLVNLAALFRVFGPWIWPSQHLPMMALSASFWVAAFGIYLAVYAPMLVSPRVDAQFVRG